MKCGALLLVLAAAANLAAYGQSVSTEGPIKTTLCEIKAHPERFQHKLVQFEAVASHGFEDSMVEDAACPWGKNGNPGVWMDFGGTLTTGTKYCCGDTTKPRRFASLRVDGIQVPLVQDDVFRHFDKVLHTAPKPGQSVTVDATMQGRIFARQTRLGSNTPEYWRGYGHMGCCMLFVVTQVVSVGPTGTRPD